MYAFDRPPQTPRLPHFARARASRTFLDSASCEHTSSVRLLRQHLRGSERGKVYTECQDPSILRHQKWCVHAHRLSRIRTVSCLLARPCGFDCSAICSSCCILLMFIAVLWNGRSQEVYIQVRVQKITSIQCITDLCSSRMVEIQTKMSERAYELMNLKPEGTMALPLACVESLFRRAEAYPGHWLRKWT